MVQTIAVAPFGGDGALWSLANEWWYYVLFGLVLLSVSTNRPLLLRLATLGGSLIILGTMPTTISLWFTLWLIGVGAALVYRHWGGLDAGPAFCLMLVAFAVSLCGIQWLQTLESWSGAPQDVLNLLLDGVAALGFTVALLSAKNASWGGHRRVHHVLAGFSYTLYLVHFPALVFLGAVAHDVFGVGLASAPAPANLALVALFVVILMAFAWMFARLTEQNTPAVRDALMRGVGSLRSLRVQSRHLRTTTR
jgi:peptidoglycan/LPS O-acetylase OafA/YrhL